MSAMSQTIKGLLHRVGLDVRLLRSIGQAERVTAEEKWLKSAAGLKLDTIRTVIDIGANVGQFAKLISGACPQATIYSFEPIPECFSRLQGALAMIPGAVAIESALGECNEVTQMNRSAFTPSSSLLAMADTHKEHWPESAEQSVVEVRVQRLDDAMRGRDLDEGILIKLDVQGAEDRVIRGGRETIGKSRVIIVEVCFVELYRGQPLFDDIYSQLKRLGFSYRGNLEQNFSKNTGEILYADAVFLRSGS